MSSIRGALAFATCVLVSTLTACKSPTETCTGLACPGATTVANVTVTSPTVDSVMAVGRTAALTAVAKDANGTNVSVTFTWESQTASVISLAASGGNATASALTAGTSIIHVTQDNNAQFGNLKMRAVNADLPGVTTTLGDAFAVALRNALTATPKSTISTQLTSCASNVTSGNLLAIKACITNMKAVTSSDPTDQALLGVLRLFFDRAQTQLQL
jgi:hypothetical protein